MYDEFRTFKNEAEKSNKECLRLPEQKLFLLILASYISLPLVVVSFTFEEKLAEME